MLEQALEAIKLLSGVGKPLSRNMLLVDCLAGRFTSIKLRGRVGIGEPLKKVWDAHVSTCDCVQCMKEASWLPFACLPSCAIIPCKSYAAQIT
jgi:hypothetical protein